MFVLIFDIEIFGDSTPVMRQNEVLDDGWQVVFLCHFHAFGHMTDDNLRTILITHVVMRVHSGLSFGEEYRVGHLTYVVIKGARTYQQAVGTDAVGYL